MSTKGESGEVEAVPKEKFWDVVDQCYLCDLCYMVKCPYVPPHPWNVDFPHLMLRAKAYQFNNGTMKHPVRDAALSSTDRNGKLATIPVVVQVVNASAKSAPLRALGEKVVGVAQGRVGAGVRSAQVPPERGALRRRHPVRDGERTPGKVAVFSTCYVNYNEPGIGPRPAQDPRPQRDSLRAGREGSVLRHAQARAGRPRSRSRSSRT